MAKTTNYSTGKNTAQQHVASKSGGSKVFAGNSGPGYSAGKHSSIARGIATGRSGSSKVDVGYGAGQKGEMDGRAPDKKNRSSPFKPGGRS